MPRFTKTHAAVLVLIAAAAVYCNSLQGGFISDDHPIVVENPLVRKPVSLAGIFASPYWPRNEPSRTRHASGGLYRPLAILSYALNRRLFGPGPVAFHLVNVALHASASVLLFLLLGLMGFSLWASMIGALAFAVLPIHAEAVSWIVGRAEILGAAFVLAAWLLLHGSEDWVKIAAGLGCYSLALLSKESAAPFPAALILGEIFRSRESLKRLAERRLVVWLSACGVLILYLAWRKGILGSAFSVGAPYFSTQSPLVVRLTMARFFFQGWLGPMASGAGLCADYSRPSFPNAAAGDPVAWAALLSILLVLAWAARDFLKNRSAWAFSALVLACFAAPLSNLLVPMEIIGAERIMYLPSIGFCLLIASAWEKAAKRPAWKYWKAAFAAGCLAWWSATTILRNRVWRSSADYFSAAVACAPSNPRALTGMGVTADQGGRHAEARGFYREALKNDPALAEAAYDMGKSYYEEGDWRSAKAWFQDLERRSLADKDAFCMLGLIAEKRKRYRDALRYYAKALELDPSALEPRYNAGLLLYRMGRVRAATEQLREYLRDSPPEQDARSIENFLEQIKGGDAPRTGAPARSAGAAAP